MKIGLFTDTYIPQANGVATSVEGLARSLEARGHTVTIIAPQSPGYKDKKKNVIRLRSIKVYKNPELRLASFVPERKLIQITQKEFDIIHGFGWGTITSFGLGLSKVKGIPFVATYNTRLNHYTHYFFKGRVIKPWMMEKAAGMLSNRCDCVIVPAQMIKKELQSFGVKKPIVVLPNGVDTTLYKTQKEGFLRKRLHIPRKYKILLYVGRLEKEKSIDFLLKAFVSIHKKVPAAVFVLVGDGSEKKKLMTLAKRLDIEKYVYFAGVIATKNIPKVYHDAELFLFSSRTETQGMVVSEALAAGLPVVAVRDAVFTNVIIDGVNGVLMEKNIPAFAKQVISLMHDEKRRHQMTKAALEMAQRYSLDVTAQAFENVYNQMINSKEEGEKISIEKLFRDYLS